MRDVLKFQSLMAAMSELYGKEVTQGLMDLYWSALSEFTDEQVGRAIESGIRKWKCFGRLPSPAEIIDEIGGGEDKALVAWEMLQQAVSRAGAYQSVRFEDPKISRVIKILGGWEAVCLWALDELQFRRQEFLKAYRGLPEGGQSETLAGINDRQNAALGYPETSPVLIGKETSRPALPDRSIPELELTDSGERVPVREVLKALDGDFFGLSSKPDRGLNH